MMTQRMNRGQLKIGISNINTYSNVIVSSEEKGKTNLRKSRLTKTFYYVNNLEIMVVKPDDKLTEQVIDRILQNFVDFMYPFLKNYFDNIDKFNLEKADVADRDDGGIMSDIRKFYEHGS